jgi:hypothetical protein
VRALTARLCNPLKPTDGLALDADEDAQRRVGVTLVVLDVRRVDRREDGVEGAEPIVGRPPRRRQRMSSTS